MAGDLFDSVLAWWHQVTVLRVRRAQSAEVDLAGEDADSSRDDLPWGALDGDDEFGAQDVIEPDDPFPD